MAEEEKPQEAPAPAAEAPQTLPNYSNLTPIPGRGPVGNIFTDFNPKGAMGGLFAPAFIRGYEPSEKAVDDYQKSKLVTRQQVEDSRMPWEWEAPQAVNPMTWASGSGYIGASLPTNQTYGDKRGLVDPNALLAQAQGGPYDSAGRREAIAARVAANQAASDSYAQQHQARYGYLPSEAPRGPFAGAGPQGGNTLFANMSGDPGWRQEQMSPRGGRLNAPGWGMYGG